MKRPVTGIMACNKQLGPETAQTGIDRYVGAALDHTCRQIKPMETVT